MMKLWGGRFSKQTHKLMEEFNSSLSFDKRLYSYDIKGSIAHVKMLSRTGVLSKSEAETIIKGLQEIKEEIDEGIISLEGRYEDIHSLVEKNLIDKVGAVGGKLHTARSRNDQVALDTRLYLRDEIFNIQELLIIFLKTLLELGEKYKKVVMPGYTHLQRAQPVSMGHHLLAYYFKLKRDYDRLNDNMKRVNVLPLGCGALAGTTFPIDREWVARELGFEKIALNSIDGVSDRDYIIEFMGIAASIMVHLSRFSAELILWSSSEFSFIELDDSFTTGSSIMPQKKNPDVAELVRGKSGRIFGNLVQLLSLLKGLPLAYNKDMQEDKEALFDTIDNLKIILEIFPPMLKTMKVNKDRLYRAANRGFVNATDLADYLARKGVPFREAHGMVGKAVLYALEKDKELNQITIEEWNQLFPDYGDIFDKGLSEILDVNTSLNNRKSSGGPAPEEVERVISIEREWIESFT